MAHKEAITYSTHSMKATLLSWVGKQGFPRDIRRMLGGHKKPGDRMPDLYCRQAMAEPLRQLGHGMLWVTSGGFDPDATKSGRWNLDAKDMAPSLAGGVVGLQIVNHVGFGDADPRLKYASELLVKHQHGLATNRMDGATP